MFVFSEKEKQIKDTWPVCFCVWDRPPPNIFFYTKNQTAGIGVLFSFFQHKNKRKLRTSGQTSFCLFGTEKTFANKYFYNKKSTSEIEMTFSLFLKKKGKLRKPDQKSFSRLGPKNLRNCNFYNKSQTAGIGVEFSSFLTKT